MKWLKRLCLFFLFLFLVQLILITDVFLNADKNIKIEVTDDNRFKIKLFLRNFYIKKNRDINLNKKGEFKIERFPEKSFGDGLNFSQNISPVFTWESWVREERKLSSNFIIIPYDIKLFFIYNINKIIVFEVKTNSNGDPIFLKYSILPDL